MKDRVFLDTNILLYSYSSTESIKQNIARNLIKNNNSYISTQVLQELTNIITKKFKFSFDDAMLAINESCRNNNLYTNNYNTIFEACKIAERYQFSFYDSLIIAAAIECNCVSIYTEDLNHNQLIFNSIVIINPFK